MSDTVYTDGFPKGWSMVHRTDCTLLCTPPDYQGLTNAICAAPKLRQGEKWLETARMIASSVARENRTLREISRSESCDYCGYGPCVDGNGDNLPNTHAVKNWTCDNCNHVNHRPTKELASAIAASDARLADAEAMAEALRGAEVTIQNLINVMGTPDQRQCCDGRECGCMGATVYQEAEYYAGKELKAVVAALEKWEAGK